MSFRLPDPKRLNTYAGIWLYLLGRIIKFEFGRYEFASASDKHETPVSITNRVMLDSDPTLLGNRRHQT